MFNISPPHHIPGYESDILWLKSIASAGYMIGVNHTNRGTEFFDSDFPVEWRTTYEKNRYLFVDPVVHSFLRKDGDIRWSKVKWRDVFGVMKAAREYGLVYGASFVRSNQGNKSMLSVARSDREISDDEMGQVSDWWTQFVDKANQPLPVNPAEIDALSCILRNMTVTETANFNRVTETAMKSRLKSARQKLNCKNNTSAAVILVRKKIL